MPGMFLDAVVTVETFHPIFNGPREEVLQWLRDNPQVGRWARVVTGENLTQMTVDDYKLAYDRK